MVKTARKKKNNRYAQVAEAQLDLHGYYAEEARSMTREFLKESQKSGFSRVRIIVGKGTHSAQGRGVLGDMVKNLLTQEGHDYTYAKREDGGEGALVVRI